jgi:hypothetical protein
LRHQFLTTIKDITLPVSRIHVSGEIAHFRKLTAVRPFKLTGYGNGVLCGRENREDHSVQPTRSPKTGYVRVVNVESWTREFSSPRPT